MIINKQFGNINKTDIPYGILKIFTSIPNGYTINITNTINIRSTIPIIDKPCRIFSMIQI